jgi:hypothetical protein
MGAVVFLMTVLDRHLAGAGRQETRSRRPDRLQPLARRCGRAARRIIFNVDVDILARMVPCSLSSSSPG